jgi:hypothetical protein
MLLKDDQEYCALCEEGSIMDTDAKLSLSKKVGTGMIHKVLQRCVNLTTATTQGKHSDGVFGSM